VVTLAQREALRPQFRRVISVPLDVPLNPAAHRVSGPVPCINHFVAGRGRLDAVPLHVVCNSCVVSCHECRSVLFLSVALPEFDTIRANDTSVSQDEQIVFETVAAPAAKADFPARFHF
jgi:hypothetical protein